MLDQTTKRKIDSLRDILVGKVPDPKQQVDQITNALIYKFMDDMDKEAQELGGEAKFFTGNFKRYSWTKLLDNRLSGQERLDLYVQAISNMSKNSHIPQLFRDVFKDAFLPYRSPETLSLFLKEINNFTYDHSEDLGDAFEYLLSILGSQGAAGQFRTPRHIIDFIVGVVDPKKDDTILDPACGTSGFLISAYKHILRDHDGVNNKTGKPTTKEKHLTPDERKKLANNFVGYDISPDMVKLSLVNMYLHGFQEPKIYEYDTLSSEKRWGEQFDVIMANPPFMTPKGGIRPHKRFSVQANRSEVLFVDYILEHLNQKGRAGIIVPEGIIFKTENAYKKLRQMLVEDGLFAVVSLPAGVFNPYSGVKTSILFLDREIAKKSERIFFVKIDNDGFNLGVQRRPIEENDLPEALRLIKRFCEEVKQGRDPILAPDVVATRLADPVLKEKIKMDKNYPLYRANNFDYSVVTKKQITENGDYNLTGERYKENKINKNQKWSMVELGEILEYEQPTKYIVNSVDYDDNYKTPVLTAGKSFILGYTDEKGGIFPITKLPVVIFDDFTTAIKFVDFPFKVKSSAMKILHVKKDKADIVFLFNLMNTIKFIHDVHKRYWISEYSKIKIPLPPLEVQKEIVKQIEVKQNVIKHTKEVIENLEKEIGYFGQSLRKLEDVEWVELGEVVDFIRGPFGGSLKKEIFKPAGYLVYEQYHAINNDFEFGRYFIDKNKFNEMRRFQVFPGDLLVSCSGTMGKTAIVPQNCKQGIINQALLKLTPRKDKLITKFLKMVLEADFIQNRHFKDQSGSSIQNVASVRVLKKIKIPLPSLGIQKQLVAEAEKEEEIITTNKKLIELMERKIEKVLNEI